MKTLLLLSLLCFGFFHESVAAQEKIGIKFKIGGDSELEGQVRSYFAREFRAIGDVEITDEQALLGVDIVIMEGRSRAGASLGYTMSLAITDRTPVFSLAIAGSSATTDPEKQKQIAQLIPEGGILLSHILQTIDTQSLAKSCKELAALIDGTHVERIRKQRAASQKQMQNQQKK